LCHILFLAAADTQLSKDSLRLVQDFLQTLILTSQRMDQKSAADHSFDVSIHAFILFMTMRLLHLALAAGESAVLEKYLI